MQISGATASSMGLGPMLTQQHHHAAEDAAVQAEDVAAKTKGAPPPQQSEAGANAEGNAEKKDAKPGSSPEQAQAKTEKDPLTDPNSAEYAQVKELQARDTEVRAHEQAHLNAAGKYATNGPTYTFQTGPDGQQYAIGGEVGIDVSEVPDDPAATIAKMQVVQRAALAPAEPSGQDMRVAAQAAQTASAARAELASQQFEKIQGQDKSSSQAGEEKQPTATEKEALQSYQPRDKEPGEQFEAVA